MKNINDLHTTGKNSRNIQSKRTKGFGYQVLGFGAGAGGPSTYVEATGGTIITDGDFKIHVFTGPGSLCVSSGGAFAPCTGCGSNIVDYLVIAGGGAGGGGHGGGGGGGGLRAFMPATTPMAAPAGLSVCIQAYPITVGGGGPAGTGAGAPKKGADSIFSSITSTGGGGGGSYGSAAVPGGSGGGGGGGPPPSNDPQSGNAPPVSPAQGTPSGQGSVPAITGGGGGGANDPGSNAPSGAAGQGGDGGYIPDAMIGPTAPSYGTPGPAGSTRYWAGGGGGGGYNGVGRPGAPGGAGGGATGPSVYGGAGDNAVANTGGGGGGGNCGNPPGGPGGSGGSGVVMIRYKFQN